MNGQRFLGTMFGLLLLGAATFFTSARSEDLSRGATTAGPLIVVKVDLAFNSVCIGQSSSRILQLFNVGSSPLNISSISRVAGSSDIEIVSGPPTPITVAPNEEIDYMVQFSPTAEGSKTATLQINSDDPFQPTKQLVATGAGRAQSIVASIAGSGAFGNVCIGTSKELDLTINNPGTCDLTVGSIKSSLNEFKVVQGSTDALVIPAGSAVSIPVRFQPTQAGGPKTANITISSNAPGSENTKVVAVTGSADPVDIRITGSTDFSDVCAGTVAERTLAICNAAACDLPVTGVSLGNCVDFKLTDNPFPGVINRDSCRNVSLRFTPTFAGPRTCTLTIQSADPKIPVIKKDVIAKTPAPLVEISADEISQAVVQTGSACRSLQAFPITNKGSCEVLIKSISIGGMNATDFAFLGLPSLPLTLQPGQSIGDSLQLLFTPGAIDRTRHGSLVVSYVSDPFSGATTTLIRDLCGEGVNTGARILVTVQGVPVPFVEKLELQRVTGDKDNPEFGTVDSATSVPLQSVESGEACAAFKYHREYGTVANPTQLSPALYQVVATVLIDGKPRTLTMPFEVTPCGFNGTVVVAF